MPADLTLFGGGAAHPRHATAHETAARRTLRAWRPHLTGDSYAAARVLLIDSARNIDRMVARQRHDPDRAPTEYALAMVLRTHADLLARWAPASESAGDPLAAFDDEA